MDEAEEEKGEIKIGCGDRATTLVALPERAQSILGLDNGVVSAKYKATIQLLASGVEKSSGCLKAEWR